eukprot:m.13605 g.13605  ORF g.13605 m.13605 type:complete len:255 (-) comp10187_c0_seq1:100-864(-)
MSLRSRLVAKEKLYLERQKRFNCAIHATNNILQESAFDQLRFDAICDELPQFGRWTSPYKSSVPYVGYYDASVVVTALMERGLELQQHDSRKPFDGSKLASDKFYGLIFNVRSRSKAAFVLRLFRLAQGRHWLCVVPVKSGPSSMTNSLATDTVQDAAESVLPEATSVATEASSQLVEARDTDRAMDLQPVEATTACAATPHDDDGWKAMQFAWLDSVRSKPTILTGLELVERVNELLRNDGSVYMASPVTPVA